MCGILLSLAPTVLGPADPSHDCANRTAAHGSAAILSYHSETRRDFCRALAQSCFHIHNGEQRLLGEPAHCCRDVLYTSNLENACSTQDGDGSSPQPSPYPLSSSRGTISSGATLSGQKFWRGI